MGFANHHARSHRRMVKRAPQLTAPSTTPSSTDDLLSPTGSSTGSTASSTPKVNNTSPSSPAATSSNNPGSTSNSNTNPNTDQENGGLSNTDTATDPTDPKTSSSTTSTTTSTSTTSSTTTTTTSSTSSFIASFPTTASSQTFSTTPLSLPSSTVPSHSVSASAASPTTSGTSSGSLSTGAIVGIAAGGLVGFGVLVTVGLWAIKRFFRNSDHDDADDYARNSIHVEDEPDYFNQPRPPTMIERHFGAAGIGAHGNVSYNPGDMVPPPVNPFMTPVGSPVGSSLHSSREEYPQQAYQDPAYPPNDHTMYNQQPVQDNYGHRPSAPGQYADLQRASITPYQAAQYDEISHQLNVTSVAHSPEFDGRVMSPTQQPARERITSPPPMIQEIPRVMSPENVNIGPYAFPMPTAVTPVANIVSPRAPNFSLPSPRPESGNAQLVTIPENAYSGNETPVQYGFHDERAAPHSGVRNHLSPPHAQGARPPSAYEEEDAYGGM